MQLYRKKHSQAKGGRHTELKNWSGKAIQLSWRTVTQEHFIFFSDHLCDWPPQAPAETKALHFEHHTFSFSSGTGDAVGIDQHSPACLCCSSRTKERPDRRAVTEESTDRCRRCALNHATREKAAWWIHGAKREPLTVPQNAQAQGRGAAQCTQPNPACCRTAEPRTHLSGRTQPRSPRTQALPATRKRGEPRKERATPAEHRARPLTLTRTSRAARRHLPRFALRRPLPAHA